MSILKPHNTTTSTGPLSTTRLARAVAGGIFGTLSTLASAGQLSPNPNYGTITIHRERAGNYAPTPFRNHGNIYSLGYTAADLNITRVRNGNGATLVNYGDGHIENTGAAWENFGSLYNNGDLVTGFNHQDSRPDLPYIFSYFFNCDRMRNTGLIENRFGFFFNGHEVNRFNGYDRCNSSGTAYFYNSGTLINYGISGNYGILDNKIHASIENNNTFYNNASLNNEAQIHNNLLFVNRNELTNYGFIDNSADGLFISNNSLKNRYNSLSEGIIQNYGTMVMYQGLDNSGVIINRSYGTLRILGTTNNDSLGYLGARSYSTIIIGGSTSPAGDPIPSNLNNRGRILNEGTIENRSKGTLTLNNIDDFFINRGKLINDAGFVYSSEGSISVNYGLIKNNERAIFTIVGTLQNAGLEVYSTADFKNYGNLLIDDSGSIVGIRREPSHYGNFYQKSGHTQLDGSLYATHINILGGSICGSNYPRRLESPNPIDIGDEAVVCPGSSPGILAAKGDLDFAGQLEIEIAGTDDHDVLDVLGNVDFLDGSRVTFFFINDFIPNEGETFEFLKATTITGLENVTFSAAGYEISVENINGNLVAGFTPSPMLDQSQPEIASTVSYVIGSQIDQRLAQVVTAGYSGKLVQIGAPIICNPDGNLILETRDVMQQDDGRYAPGTAIRSTTTIPGDQLPIFSDTSNPDFRLLKLDSPVALRSGEMFAFTLDSDVACGIPDAPKGDLYKGGDAWITTNEVPPDDWQHFGGDKGKDDWDLPFETWMEVNPLAPLALAGLNTSAVVAVPTDSNSIPERFSLTADLELAPGHNGLAPTQEDITVVAHYPVTSGTPPEDATALQFHFPAGSLVQTGSSIYTLSDPDPVVNGAHLYLLEGEAMTDITNGLASLTAELTQTNSRGDRWQLILGAVPTEVGDPIFQPLAGGGTTRITLGNDYGTASTQNIDLATIADPTFQTQGVETFRTLDLNEWSLVTDDKGAPRVTFKGHLDLGVASDGIDPNIEGLALQASYPATPDLPLPETFTTITVPPGAITLEHSTWKLDVADASAAGVSWLHTVDGQNTELAGQLTRFQVKLTPKGPDGFDVTISADISPQADLPPYNSLGASDRLDVLLGDDGGHLRVEQAEWQQVIDSIF